MITVNFCLCIALQCYREQKLFELCPPPRVLHACWQHLEKHPWGWWGCQNALAQGVPWKRCDSDNQKPPAGRAHGCFVLWSKCPLPARSRCLNAALGSAQASAEGYWHTAPGRQAWGCSGHQGSFRLTSQATCSVAPSIPSLQEVLNAWQGHRPTHRPWQSPSTIPGRGLWLHKCNLVWAAGALRTAPKWTGKYC